MPKRISRHSKVVMLNIRLQNQIARLEAQAILDKKKLEVWAEGKDEARNAFVDARIKDLNMVIRSIGTPRKDETGEDVGKRFVQALTALEHQDLTAAKQFFDNPPKEKA